MDFTLSLKDGLSNVASRMKSEMAGLKSTLSNVGVDTEKVEAAQKSLAAATKELTGAQKNLASATKQRLAAQESVVPLSAAAAKAEQAHVASITKLNQAQRTEGTSAKEIAAAKKAATSSAKALTVAKKAAAAAAKKVVAAEQAEAIAAQGVASASAKAAAAQKALAKAKTPLGAQIKMWAKSEYSLKNLGGLTKNWAKETFSLQNALGKAKGVAAGFASAGLMAVKVAAVAAVAALAALAAGVVALGVKLTAGVVKGSEFARTTKAMFAAYAGGNAKAGEQALGDILDIAKKTSAPLEEIRVTMSTLKATGIKGQLLKDLTAMRFDFKAMGEEAEAAFGKISDAMVEGEVTASQFEDMAKNLGGKQLFGKALGLSDVALQNTQKGVEQLGKELKQLDPEKFLEIVAATAKAQRGIGATSKAAKTFGERWESLKEIFFTEVGKDVDLGFGAIFEDIEKWAASDAGQATIAELKDAFNELGGVVKIVWDDFKILAAGFADGLDIKPGDTGEFIKSIGDRLKDPETQRAIKDFGRSLGVLAGAVTTVGDAIAGSQEKFRFFVASTLGSFSSALAGPLTPLVTLTSFIGALVPSLDGVKESFNSVSFGGFKEKLDAAVSWVVGLGPALWEAASAAAANLADGFSAGINERLAAVKETIAGVASSIKDTLAGALGIHSKSTVGIEFGGHLQEGLAYGMTANDNATKGASALASSVKSTMSDELGIHSPSVETARMMEQMFQGAGSPQASAAPQIVMPEIAPAPGAAPQLVLPQIGGMPASTDGGGGAITIQVGDIHIHADSIEGGLGDLEQQLRDMLARAVA